MFKIDLNNNLTEFLLILCDCAAEFKTNLYIVGGALRDTLSGYKVKDFDLIIDGNALEFSEQLPDSINVVSYHKDFSTIKVSYNNTCFDIASTRLEHYPASGCLPVVDKVGVNINQDIIRRDFTINTLYCRLYNNNGTLGFELTDILSAMDDINQKKLKVLHKNSYIDDPTRILRGLGLKHRFGFEFDLNNTKLINRYLENIDYSGMSYDRCKMVMLDTIKYSPYKIFTELIEKKYYKIIQPEDLNVDFSKIEKCIEYFNMDKDTLSDFFISVIENKECFKQDLNTYSQILSHFNRYQKNDIAYYYYKTSDSNALDYLKLQEIKINLTGNDLIFAGYLQGKIFSEIFDKLLEAKFKNPKSLKDKTEELNYVKTLFPLNEIL